MTKNLLSLLCFCSLPMIFFVACNKTVSGNGEQSSAQTVEQERKQEKANDKVVSIVFVGQKQACDCTRNRIETTWNTLTEVLKKKPELPVKRIARDVDVEEAENMAVLKPLMVAPGIYFLGAQDDIVDLLQGEVSKEQIESVILRKPLETNP